MRHPSAAAAALAATVLLGISCSLVSGFVVPTTKGLTQHHVAARCRPTVIMAAAPPQEPQERKGISEDDPLVQRIRDDVLRETGVELDQLLNPSKVRVRARAPVAFVAPWVHYAALVRGL